MATTHFVSACKFSVVDGAHACQWRRALVAMVVTFGAACGGDSPPGQQVLYTDAVVTEGGVKDVGVDTGPSTFPDTTPGAGEDTGLAIADTSGEEPSWFGKACAKASDCPSGWCLEGRCTDTCVDECPTGWTCKNVSTSGADVAYVCAPDVPVTCATCVQDVDCAATGARCVAIADEGKFCSLPCADGTCGPGLECRQIDGTSQCVPATDTCLCGEKTKGTSRVCSVDFGTATCQGQKTCNGITGWSECSAGEPTPEMCNGIDDDCDDLVDEVDAVGCVDRYADSDDDGYGIDGDSRCVCEGDPLYIAEVGGDCDDDEDNIFPGASEICNTIDDDCDGQTDSADSKGCTNYLADGDADGFGVVGIGACVCQPTAPWTALIGGDCDDEVQSTSPNAPEACNLVDDDCDGDTDEKIAGSPCIVENEWGGCSGVATCENGAGVCKGKEPGPESCNGSDDDCDGSVDEGTSGELCIADNQYGSCSGTLLCLGAAGLICDADDAKKEVCNNEDDDCDSQIDETGSEGCVEYYADLDSDGFGADDIIDCLCKPTAPFTANYGGDCDDGIKSTYPGASEVCDGADNDCDSATDEAGAQGCTIYLVDADDDGYSPASVGPCLCESDGDYTAKKSGDCDDGTALLSPGVVEICDGQDQNCNQIADETCDKDGDGFCDANAEVVGTPAVCKNGGGDCNDSDAQTKPGGVEVCNGRDDDCDGVADEGVTAPCGGCAEVCVLGAGPGQPLAWMADPEAYDGTNTDEAGFVKLDVETVQLRSVWIANSGEGTVSRLDTISGREVARYNVCADPSRTAVAGDGSVWVGCRGDGKVGHIALDLENCVDRNGNGAIETSSDTNGDKVINGLEMLAQGADECVLLVVQPDGATVARGLAIDKEDKVWVAFWNSQRLLRLDPLTGAVLKSVDFAGSGGRPYGLALDQDGGVWVALRDLGRLGYYDATNPAAEPRWWNLPNGYNAYGMAVDQLGQVWVANGENQTVSAFDPKTEQFTVVVPNVAVNTRGVAASLDGFVYLAHHSWDKGCDAAYSRWITKIDSATKQVVASWDLGGLHGTVGVSIDFEGHLWAINQCVSTATKIDTNTGNILGEFPTGPGPYTYSDMTGFALKTVVAPVGTYRHVFAGWENGATYWQTIDVGATVPDQTRIELRYRTAASVDTIDTALWSQWFGSFPPEPMPFQVPSWAPAVGRYLEVQVRLRTDDKKLSPQLERLTATASDAP